jgi:lysine-specific demethylase 8
MWHTLRPAIAQVWGRKRVRIYDAVEKHRLYPYPRGVLRNTSQVDCDAVDAASFPAFSEAGFMECIVEPGQMLYLPKKFWHEVVALTGSLSLSFWWT